MIKYKDMKQSSTTVKKKRRGKIKKFVHEHKVWSVVIILVAIILVIVLTAFIYFTAKASLLQRNNSNQISGDSGLGDDLSADTDGLPAGKIKEADGAIFKDDNVFNVMLIGTDERSKEFSTNARGDSCMIMSINKSTGKIKLVSFERATGVKILDGEYKGQYDWLTHSFRYGGPDLMMKEIRESYKIDVTHYVRTNIYTFMQLVDSVGGVDINLTKEEADYINNPKGTFAEGHIAEMHVQNKVQKVKVGTNHLNGATAMVYARCRAIDSDWHRVERQRNVIKSSVSNIKKLNPIELDSMLNNVLPLVQTNLSNQELANLMTISFNFHGIDDTTMTFPVKDTYGSMTGMGGRSMFATDFQKNSDILQQFLYGKS